MKLISVLFNLLFILFPLFSIGQWSLSGIVETGLTGSIFVQHNHDPTTSSIRPGISQTHTVGFLGRDNGPTKGRMNIEAGFLLEYYKYKWQNSFYDLESFDGLKPINYFNEYYFIISIPLGVWFSVGEYQVSTAVKTSYTFEDYYENYFATVVAGQVLYTRDTFRIRDFYRHRVMSLRFTISKKIYKNLYVTLVYARSDFTSAKGISFLKAGLRYELLRKKKE